MVADDLFYTGFFIEEKTSVINPSSRAKLYEFAAASPLIVWLSLGIAGSAMRISQMAPGWESAIAISSQIATILLLGLVVVFLVIRRPAVRKARGMLPRVVAVAGFVSPYLAALLPRANISPATLGLPAAIALLGITASILAVFFLGRSFSILPQARQLVTDGPYRIVRHPLYLAELVVVLGTVWEIDQPWPLIVLFAAIGIQVLRMRFEEQVLSETFPRYREYAKRTARLVPGVY
jgi:protein-S-isoprenylcysteine O-methyltransferase Ste14